VPLGSGAVAILQALKVLIKNDFKPLKSVEFHFYAAEEVGLRGSQDIAVTYQKRKEKVAGVLQIDMCGYTDKANEHIGLFTDNVDQQLTHFLIKLLDNYTHIPYRKTSCGYGCSDHAAWKRVGYPTSFVSETVFDEMNPFIHSEEDTVDRIDFDHMAQFVQLALGFAVEMAEWK
jgi:leucyl aminopeptidase